MITRVGGLKNPPHFSIQNAILKFPRWTLRKGPLDSRVQLSLTFYWDFFGNPLYLIRLEGNKRSTGVQVNQTVSHTTINYPTAFRSRRLPKEPLLGQFGQCTTHLFAKKYPFLVHEKGASDNCLLNRSQGDSREHFSGNNQRLTSWYWKNFQVQSGSRETRVFKAGKEILKSIELWHKKAAVDPL